MTDSGWRKDRQEFSLKKLAKYFVQLQVATQVRRVAQEEKGKVAREKLNHYLSELNQKVSIFFFIHNIDSINFINWYLHSKKIICSYSMTFSHSESILLFRIFSPLKSNRYVEINLLHLILIFFNYRNSSNWRRSKWTWKNFESSSLSCLGCINYDLIFI